MSLTKSPEVAAEVPDPISVLDDDAPPLEARTTEQQKSYRALYGEGGFSSWERVIGGARTEDRADILKNALGELLPLAKAAAVSPVQIADWAVRQAEMYEIADPDELQQIIVKA